MNEVNMLNIGGVDYNVDDQHARDVIAHSENGLDSQSNLPVSSRHYDEGDYLIGQDRLYYEATTDIEIGDVLAVGTNLRQTIISDEIVRLKNQSSLAVINVISYNEPSGLSSRSYNTGDYLYWDYGLSAGLYEVIDDIDANDAFVIGTNIQIAPKLTDMIKDAQINYDSYNITGAKNLCPNNAADTVTTDITWDVLSDGSVQVSGTAAAQRWLQLNSSTTLPAGTYTITTGQANESTADVIMIVQKKSNNEVIARSNSYELSATFTLSQATEVFFSLWITHTSIAIDVHVYPMCRVASVSDDTYVQRAMTNAQLTTAVSHVGMIIHSTTLDTEAKVKAIYGGVSWSKIEGRFLLGQNANYAINSTGGEEMHTLTINEIPSHTHGANNGATTFINGGSYDVSQTVGNRNYSYLSLGYTGGGQPHNNMPPYKVVYIWERTA